MFMQFLFWRSFSTSNAVNNYSFWRSFSTSNIVSRPSSSSSYTEPTYGVKTVRIADEVNSASDNRSNFPIASCNTVIPSQLADTSIITGLPGSVIPINDIIPKHLPRVTPTIYHRI